MSDATLTVRYEPGPPVLEPPLSDADLQALQQRNRERARRAIEQMGALYCCHAKHAPQRKEAPC